jgi:import inner membrane translocase subunit TIM17
MFSTFDCSLAALRQKEDPWNSIISGAMTGGCLAIRGGVKTAATSAVFGGVILAIMEGIGIMLTRSYAAVEQKPAQQASSVEPPVVVPPPAAAPSPSDDGNSGGSSGWTRQYASQ